jgi:hypothetical protein
MASLTKRQSGWTQVKVRRKGWPDQSASFETKTEAQAWARQIESGLDRGVLLRTSAAEKLLFTSLADRFRKDFAPHHYRAAGWSHSLITWCGCWVNTRWPRSALRLSPAIVTLA